MKKFRKILSLILSISMLLTMTQFVLPTSASAEEVTVTDLNLGEVGDGSSDKAITMYAGDATIEYDVGGIGGKASTDVAYKVKTNAPDGNRATNRYIKPAITVQHPTYPSAVKDWELLISFDFMFTTSSDRFDLVFYSFLEGKTDYTPGNFEDHYVIFTPAGISGNSSITMGGISLNQWHRASIYIPNGGSNEIIVYLDGTSYEGKLKKEMASFGTRSAWIYLVDGEMNFDNYCMVQDTAYNPAEDRVADVDFTENENCEYTPNSGVIGFKRNDVTVGDIKDATVSVEGYKQRFYSDSTYTTLLEDTDVISNNTVMVWENAKGVMRYYSFDYDSNLEHPPVNETYYKISNNQDGTVTVTGFDRDKITDVDDLSAISIPEYIAGAKVTAIGIEAFRDEPEIQSVVIADSVETIGNYAFSGEAENGAPTGNLTSVTLPKNLKTIGPGAFARNGRLAEIEIPDGVETIGAEAFYWSGLTSITIPNSVTSMGFDVFRLCGNLKYAKLSAGLTSIPKGTFTSCGGIAEIVIPETITGEELQGGTFTEYDIDLTIYGIEGSFAESFANANGYEFVEVLGGTIVSDSKLLGDAKKVIKGTDYDIKTGFEKISFNAQLANIGTDPVEVVTTMTLYDESGEVVESDVLESEIASGKVALINEESDLFVDATGIKDGYKITVTFEKKSDNLKLCDDYTITFDESYREIHVLAIANSFCNDSFGYINNIAEADGVLLHVQNMYIGGASLTNHFDNMKFDKPAYQPIVNMKYGEEGLKMKDALQSDKWDVVALQCATHGLSNDLAFVDYETANHTVEENGEIVAYTTGEIYEFIRDYVAEYAPDAKRMMHMSWGTNDETSRTIYNNRFADAGEYPAARLAVYNLHKEAYHYGASIFSTEDHMLVPTSEAIKYAIDDLGFEEYVDDSNLNDIYYDSSARAMFRDTTSHLSLPYGRVLAGLTWYEYLTGNDVRNNPYQISGIPESDMALLKQAAHYACSMAEYNPETEEVEIDISAIGGTIKASINSGTEADFETGKKDTYAVGTEISLTAVPSETSKFLYWKDNSSNAIVSTNETFEFVVGTSRGYTAVFADSDNGAYITFRVNGKIVASGYSNSDNVTVPADPYAMGYKFEKWFCNGEETTVQAGDSVTAEENVEYVAGFILDSTQYDVSINDGNTTATEAYKYNEEVTAEAADKSGEGLEFTHWEKDGKIVSYSKTYTFYVNGITSVVAKYASEAAEKAPVLVMASPVKMADVGKIAFYAERDIPANCTVIETGILLDEVAGSKLDTAGVIKSVAKSKANKGQYTIRKVNVETGNTWYGKAYVIYKDGDSIKTIYSNEESLTF